MIRAGIDCFMRINDNVFMSNKLNIIDNGHAVIVNPLMMSKFKYIKDIVSCKLNLKLKDIDFEDVDKASVAENLSIKKITLPCDISTGKLISKEMTVGIYKKNYRPVLITFIWDNTRYIFNVV